MAIGNTNTENTYAWENYGEYAATVIDNSIYSIIDSGASTIMISTLYYENFIKRIMDRVSGVEWSYQEGYVYTPCDADYPNLYFMFD